MLGLIKDFWDAIPRDVKNIVEGLAVSLVSQSLGGRKKDKDLETQLKESYKEGLKGFLAGCGKHIADHDWAREVLKNDAVQECFLGMIQKKSTPEAIEDVLHDVGFDTVMMDQSDIRRSLEMFVMGFMSKAERSEKVLTWLNSIHLSKISELTEINKKILKILEGETPDLPSLRGKYFNFLKANYAQVSISGLSEGKLFSPPLEKVFTRLRFSREVTGHEKKSRKGKDDLLPSALEGRDVVREATLAEILDSPYAIITGAPGAGKSTILKYIALAFAEGKQKERLGIEGNYLPILFPVVAYDSECKVKGSGCSIKSFISEYFKGQSLPDLSNLFSVSLTRGEAYVLIDGLDEVAAERDRVSMVDDIRKFIIDTGTAGNRYCVTCRTESYTKASRFEAIQGREFFHVETLPFNVDQMAEFLLSWYRFYEREVQGKGEFAEAATINDRDSMMSVIRGDANIRYIAQNPLMLTILALIEHEGGKLPDRRADLYKRCLSLLVNSWEDLRTLHTRRRQEDRKEFTLGGLKITDTFVISVMAPIAWGMLEKAEEHVSYRDLKEALSLKFDGRNRDIDLSRQQADEFITIMKVRSGIIREVSPERYDFMHKTFKEYLAARLLTDLCDDPFESLGDKLFTPEWREVVLLAAAVLPEYRAGQFIRGIWGKETDGFRNLILAGECVKDAGMALIDAELCNEIIDEMTNAVGQESNCTVEDRVAIGEILGWLGDPRDLDGFVPVKGGTYTIGKKVVPITDFDIARYPVTNGWYRSFIDDKGYKKPEYWSDEGRRWLGATGVTHPRLWHERKWSCPNAPVVGVSWYEADAFARWLTATRHDGKRYRLPTQDEWFVAAAGGAARTYPWGDEWDKRRANTSESGVGKTSSVGVFSSGVTPKTGISDLAGNVWEWTRTDYHSDCDVDDFTFDKDAPKALDDRNDDRRIEMSGEKLGKLPVLRGGSWFLNHENARWAGRVGGSPDGRGSGIGFRCLRTKK